MRRPDPDSATAPQPSEPRAAGPPGALRGEFVWEGKYDATGRRREPELPPWPVEPVPLERCGESAGHEDGNLLLGGDNLLALAALLPAWRSRVQLIYIDPPFDTGTDHVMRVPMGSRGRRVGAAAGGPAPQRLDVVAYRDAWGQGGASYLQRMYERLVPMRELLRPSGVLCLHCDWRSHAPLRLLLDEVFGPERFLNEIVWHYYNKYSPAAHHLPRAHDTILMYARGPRPALNALRLPREQPSRQLVRENVNGVLRNARDGQGRLRYRTVHDRKGDDVWRIPQLQPASAQWSGYSTQKHHDLLERIVALGSREGDVVADFFCGSGTTLAVAQRMGRRWIGCDQGAMALHTTRKRLLRARAEATEGLGLEAAAAPPFALDSLEPAARRRWLERECGGDPATARQAVLAALGARVFNAATLADPDALHGTLEDGFCAFPAPAQPCSLAHARGALRATQRAGARRLYLLAWEFDPRWWSQCAAERAPGAPELVPLIVPAALVTPAGNAPPVFRRLPRPRLRVEADAAAGADNAWRLRMEGYAAGPSRPAWSGRWEPPPSVAGEPLALLDGWSVDPGWQPGGPFRHHWWDFRSPHKRTLADRSPDWPQGGGQPCVLLADVWGTTTLHAVERDAHRPAANDDAGALPAGPGLR